jgi:mannan endo-1,4-beta-mannosidase
MNYRKPRSVSVATIALCAGLCAGLVTALGVVAPRSAEATIGSSFVQRCGIHFCLDGKTYYFAGANTYDVFTLGGSYGDTEKEYMNKTRIDNHFAQLKTDKVKVLRLWMFSHEDWHGFEKTKGKYNEQQFALFDYVIESAKAHDVRLIPVFENYWEAYGGIDTRLKWEGLSGGHPGRRAFFDKTKCPGCFTGYKNYVSYALNRTNHYSGIKYKDEPTIFAWELMNEPRHQDASADENKSGKTLRAWVDEMGSFIKGIDSKHLLGTGLEGHESRYGFGGDEGNPFVYIHQSPYIDFTSAHPYPTEEWANLDLAKTKTLIRAWINDSHQVVGKPFFMGEFNFKNVNRSTWWSQVYTDFEAADGDGSAFWWYLDPGNTASDNYSVKTGAPELAAFRTHSDKMTAKTGRTPSTSPSPTPNSET